MSTHTCPAPGCAREVSDDLLACRQHWYELPKPLRDALWRAYNDHGRGSPQHSAAVDACLRAFERGTAPQQPAAVVVEGVTVQMIVHADGREVYRDVWRLPADRHLRRAMLGVETTRDGATIDTAVVARFSAVSDA